MVKGHIKKLFPGGNTSQGFFSFYNYILTEKTQKIYILKGGPGVGKSTFMSYIGEKLHARGLDLEYHYCSSSNGALDSVVVPQVGVALIDGTAPHIVDPKYPGVIDQIINLGDFWDQEGLQKYKKEILSTTEEVSRCFRRTYGYLAQAKLLKEEIKSYYQDSHALDLIGLNKLTIEVISEIFTKPSPEPNPRERHLFASAITPIGPCNYMDTIFDPLKKRYIIEGESGTGKATLVNKIYQTALQLGYDVEAYHCSLVPTTIEHLIIPELQIGVITSQDPHLYQAKPNDRIINTQDFICQKSLKPFQEDLKEAREIYERVFLRAISYLARAKKYHDILEKYYIPNMNFTEINKCRDRILQEIMSLASQV